MTLHRSIQFALDSLGRNERLDPAFRAGLKPWARDPLDNPLDEQRAHSTAKELSEDMAEIAKAAADWQRVKDEFARLVRVFAVDPDFDLDDSDVAIKSLVVRLQEKIRRNHAD